MIDHLYLHLFVYTGNRVARKRLWATALTRMGHMQIPHRKSRSPNISVASLAFSKSTLMTLKIKRYSKDRRVSKQWPISSCHGHL